MILNLKTGLYENSFTVENGITALNKSPDGTKLIVVGISRRHAYIYDLETGNMLIQLDAEPGKQLVPDSAGFTEEGSKIIVKQTDGQAIVGKLLLTFEELVEYARSIISR
jgi:Tol biopolymer transport system component